MILIINFTRIITLGTFEERIMSLQKFKIQTANTVINAENQSFGTMDTSTLLDLFGNNNKEKESEGINENERRKLRMTFSMELEFDVHRLKLIIYFNYLFANMY